MTFARPLLYLLLMACIATAAFAAGDGSNSQSSPGSLPNQTADASAVPSAAEVLQQSTGLVFLEDKASNTNHPPVPRPSLAVLNDDECYTMRMYKVKRKEHFADGQSGLRGYSTCELASNYQVRSAIAHVQTAQGKDSRNDEPQK
jgi:hypothetical protein